MATWKILTVAVRNEVDVVLARQRARHVAELLGFDTVGQTRVATSVSEIARNAHEHAGGGRVEYSVENSDAGSPLFVIRVVDRGPGIERPDEVLGRAGTMGQGRGAGLGVARRLMDRFEVDSAPGRGTRVTLGKLFPGRGPGFTPADAARVADELARRPPQSLLEETYLQNQELLRVLEDLTQRQQDLVRLNTELEETNRGVLALYSQVAQELDDTNRGVLALYAELDEQAEELRRVNYLKSQFFSYVGHEFRTPLYSSIALSSLLLDGVSGPLESEQRRQVELIRKSSGDLLDMVSDLMDLAKLEAGKLEVSPEPVVVAELFSALRGMLRPLTASGAVSLVFEDPDPLSLHSDPRKLSQILRNLISNALKFTERGEVRVAAALEPDGAHVRFSVRDTGIGIAPEDLERVFDDFVQAGSPFQRRVPGTGLGLPLSRRMAAVLGGDIHVESAPGVGSTFTLTVPRSTEAPE